MPSSQITDPAILASLLTQSGPVVRRLHRDLVRDISRSGLLPFTLYTKPDYASGWFHRVLAGHLDTFLDQVMKGESPRMMVMAPPRSGKALAVGTRIPTPDGFTNIEDLRPGDYVFAVDGTPTKVRAVSPVWKNRKVYRVFSNNGSFVVADAVHEWTVRLDRGHRVVTRVRKSGRVDPPREPAWTVRETEYLAQRTSPRRPLIPCAEALILPEIDLPIPPYTLGVWLGDGKNDSGFITQGLEDAEHVMRRIAEEGFVTRAHANVLNTGILGLRVKLRELGVFQNKHIPRQYLRASRNQRMALLQGLIDTDGHVGPTGHIEFCNTNEALALGTLELVRSLGVKASLNHGRAMLYGKDCGPKYRVTFFMKDAASLPRKVERCKDGTKQPGHYLRFEEAGFADTVCIDVVHPSHLFLAGEGFLPTHNSELVSRRFPAYALGKHPSLPIIATSYSSDLASSINRDVQRIIDSEEYRDLFPGTSLWGKNIRTVADGSYLRNSDMFEVVNHRGLYKSAGVGAGITGRGGRILLIDDPIADAAQAHSQTVRNAIWEWYTTTLYTRCEPGGGILLIQTRWHEDDLAGRILRNMEKGGEQWKVLRYPAIAEEDEEYRAKGEPLHPERYSLEMLNKIKTGTEDTPGVGSRTWSALYQQRPSAAEGNIFKRENWKWLRAPKRVSEMEKHERDAYFRELGIERVIQRWDTALGAKKQADFSACVTLGIAQSRYYVLDVWKQQIEFPEVRRQVQALYDKWAPYKVIVEGGGSASGKATVQTMKRETRVPVYEAITSTDKVLRADIVSPNQESGLVYLFEGEEWTSDFVDQCANFPSIRHDDDVDAFIGAVEEATSDSGPFDVSDELLRMVGAL